MTTFQKLRSDDDIREVVEVAFGMPLDIAGGWGYSKSSALIINQSKLPLEQLEHTLASMRAQLEMNLTLPKEKRYGAININILHREVLESDKGRYEKVSFEISAILEVQYAAFIEEYKAGLERENFDIEAHFKRRKEATLKRNEIFWFEIKDALKL